MGSVSVLVVDDFSAWRQFIRSILEAQPNSSSIFEAADGVDAVQNANEYQPDLVLLDIGLPGLNGIEAARQIHIVAPNSRILFVTDTCDPDIAHEALSTGASGYVCKPDAGNELLPAIKAVMSGKRFVSRRLLGNASLSEFDQP